MQADPRGPRDYEDHLYVNTQGLDAPESLPPEDSPKKDLFDMRTWGQASLRGRSAGEAQPLPPGTLQVMGKSVPPPGDSPASWG